MKQIEARARAEAARQCNLGSDVARFTEGYLSGARIETGDLVEALQMAHGWLEGILGHKAGENPECVLCRALASTEKYAPLGDGER